MTRRTSLIAARALEAVANESDDLTDLSDLELAQKTNTSLTDVDELSEISEVELVKEVPKRIKKAAANSTATAKKGASKAKKQKNDDYVAEGSDSDYNSAKERKKAKGKPQGRRSKVAKINWTGGNRPFDTLGDEVMMTIFAQITPGKKTTHSWNLVSKRFHVIASLPYARANWLLTHYSRSNALYHCVRIGSICEEQTLNSLIDGGRACSSRYFFQMACLAYAKKTPGWLSKKWSSSETISFANWIALLTKGVELFPTLSPSTGKDDAEIIRSWIRSKGTQTGLPTTRQRRFRRWRMNADEVQSFNSKEAEAEAKDKEFEVIKDLFQTQAFCPFSDKDPLIGDFIDAININPAFMDVALAAGFEISERFKSLAFEKIFFKNISNDSKLEEFQALFSTCEELAPEAPFFEQLLTKKIGRRNRREEENEPLLHSHIELLQAFDASSLVPFSLTQPCAAAIEHKSKNLSRLELFSQAGLIYSMVETLGLGSNVIDVELAAKVVFFLAQDMYTIEDYFRTNYFSGASAVQQETERVGRLVTSATAGKALNDWNLSAEVDEDLLVTLMLDEPVSIAAVHYHLGSERSAEEVEQIMSKTAVALLWRPHQGKALNTILALEPGAKARVATVLTNEFSLSGAAIEQALKKSPVAKLHTPFSPSAVIPIGSSFADNVYAPLDDDVTASDPSLRTFTSTAGPFGRVNSSSASATANVLQKIYRSDADIQQLLLNHATLTENSKLVSSTLAVGAVISMEIFHLHAALRINVGATIMSQILQGITPHCTVPGDFEESPADPSVAVRKNRLTSWISAISNLVDKEKGASSKQKQSSNLFVDTAELHLAKMGRILQRWEAQQPGDCPLAAFSGGWCRSCGMRHNTNEEIDAIRHHYDSDEDFY